MTKKNNGGPAFPCAGDVKYDDGMTLRDYFAASVLNSVVTYEYPLQRGAAEHFAEVAYEIADAMLSERKK